MKLNDLGLTAQDIKDKVSKYMIETYERMDFVCETAKDQYLYDENGERYLPHVNEVRGQGLLVGVDFDDTIGGVDVKHECIKRHLLITAIGAHTIRMVPPLIISERDCDQAFDILKEAVLAIEK